MIALIVRPFQQLFKLISACHTDCTLVYFWCNEYSHSPCGPQAKLTKLGHNDGYFHPHRPSQICWPIIGQHRSRASAKWIVTSQIWTNGSNICSISQCCVLKESYSWFWIENPLRDLVRFEPIGSRPSKIHDWLEGLFWIPEGMFPKLMKIAYNFSFPEKFVKHVRF